MNRRNVSLLLPIFDSAAPHSAISNQMLLEKQIKNVFPTKFGIFSIANYDNNNNDDNNNCYHTWWSVVAQLVWVCEISKRAFSNGKSGFMKCRSKSSLALVLKSRKLANSGSCYWYDILMFKMHQLNDDTKQQMRQLIQCLSWLFCALLFIVCLHSCLSLSHWVGMY